MSKSSLFRKDYGPQGSIKDMKYLLQNELILMNQEYIKMFSDKLKRGTYILNFSTNSYDYEAEFKKLGYYNVKTISSIKDVAPTTIKDSSLILIGVKDNKYIEEAMNFVNLGLPWQNTFAEKDVIFFYNCLKSLSCKEKSMAYFLKLGNEQANSYYKDIDKKQQRVKKVYDSLNDELSKKIFLRCIIKKILDCPSYLDIYSPDQYVCDIVKFDNNEVIIDAGAYDGDTIKLFASKAPKFKHIYAFEPDLSSFCQLVNNTKSIDNIDYFSVGLGDVTVTKEFSKLDFGASTFRVTNENEICDKLVVNGDSFNFRPTFIKMDIEGFELEALKGFNNAIRKFAPKLAICVYHKFEDIYEIPLYIKMINPSYQLFLRHHSNNCSETVLYAI